ncbi:DUF3108 domain-containing protein [Thermocrinis sp.]|uniref:DUF3108 domain-containing protein n=1 Tax=Thermocrinis sp. TaxID=2024383 RepID=UPI002FDC8B90
MLFLLLFLPFSILANELTLCYKAYYLFFPVARTCITYQQEEENLRVSSWARTINVGGLVKRVYNYGYAVIHIKSLTPDEFFYHQEEGNFKRRQHYIFENSKIYVKEIHYVELTEKQERVEERVYDYKGYVDPYTASLILYKSAIKEKSGAVKMFYDDRIYNIPYTVVGEEQILEEYRALVLNVQPNVETKGILKPKGRWKLWIDKEKLFPVKMELLFVLGSVKVVLEEIKGDKELLKRILL